MGGNLSMAYAPRRSQGPKSAYIGTSRTTWGQMFTERSIDNSELHGQMLPRTCKQYGDHHMISIILADHRFLWCHIKKRRNFIKQQSTDE
ncbi:Hypothetical predicted protein [Mytilus galloprovincialis]|uniref:Uncharacterized protein n=1 Tax=Mytilus galloprovincialis TaxID=29158 RepID=A0A8B6EL46_MYTGA|nr:Hypothetical predicted protein [Mytilus galloprovincialis]